MSSDLTNFQKKFWKLFCKFWKDALEEFYKGLLSIPKLLILALVVAILSLTPLGNLIRCKLFDADGCKPIIDLRITTVAISNYTHNDLEKKYETIDKPRNLDLEKFHLLEHTVTIENKGFECINRMKLRFKPLITSEFNQSRLIGYSIAKGRSSDKKAYIKENREFDIKSHNFDPEPWWRLALKESANLKIAVAYSADIYAKAKEGILIIEGECTSCQKQFVNVILNKGETTE